MKNAFKRLLSLVMVLILLGSMLPVLHNHAEAAEVPEVLTDEDYVIVDDVFAQIDAMEDAPAKKGATKKELADEAVQIVMASENYVEGSLERNGDFFTWWTDEGIHCVYSPRMRKIQDNMVAPENPVADGAYNEPIAKKGGWPSSKEVFLIGPYYGSDDSFTDQYKNEATAIAKAIGDTDGYTLYSGTSATVDKVAYAVSNGAVVIFDSHGTTDFEGPPDLDDDGYGDEFVTGAKNSYLCLQTQTGMTNADYRDGALYGPGYAYINGATISNHMTTDSPAGILWMAICLGMATDTICEPLRERGVEVVYGYSQSVTFHGDYLFEEVFWDNMCAGEDVATSIAAMKAKWGNWDWSTQIAREYGYNDGYSTISAARADFAAFPIVVSDEDAHPGQRKNHTSNFGACSLQTVKSTYTLFSQYEVTAKSNNTSWGTVSVDGSTITAKPAAGYFAQSATVTSGTATVSQNGNTFTVSADSDCTVQINFAAKTMVTVSFAGANVTAQTGYAGDAMALPTVTDAPNDYSFVGWTTAPLGADTTEKPAYYTDSFIPTGNTILYALYSYEVEEEGSTGAEEYTLVTDASQLYAGAKVLIASNEKGYVNGNISSSYMLNVSATFSSDYSTISTVPAGALPLTLDGSAGAWTFANDSGSLLGATAVKKLAWGSGTTTWSISIASDGATIQNGNSTFGRFLYNVSSPRFTTYTSSTSTSMLLPQLYIQGSGSTVYYTTSLCAHTNTKDVGVVSATCTEAGYTAGVYCNDCETYISGHEEVPATGHSFDGGVVNQPYACVAGEKVYTCSACGTTKTEEIPASADHDFTTGDCACGHPAPEGFVKRWNVELTDRIGMNFHLNLTAEQAADTLVEIKCADKTVEYLATDLQLSADGYYVLSTQLAAAQMTEPVILTMLVADEIVVKEYSVRQYADYVLADANNQFDQPTKDLVLAMLHYGAAAQLNFNYKTDNLANAGYEDLVNNTLTAAEYPATQNPVDGIRHNSSTLVCRDNVAVRFYFRLDGTQTIDAYTIKFGDTVLKPVSKDGMYYVEIAGIVPQNLDELITLTVNDTMTVAYGPMVYIYRQYNKTTGTNLKNLLQQMFDYYTAAEAYIAALAN